MNINFSKLKTLFKKNNYQYPIIFTISILLIFSIFMRDNKNISKTIEESLVSKTDSIATFYTNQVRSIDSIHKNTIRVLKSTYKSNLIQKENSINTLLKETNTKSIEIAKYKSELNKFKSQFFYILDGEVSFNNFKAKGKKIVYKKGELESIIKESDNTKELNTKITELSTITKSLNKSIEIYKTDSSSYVHSIDSMNIVDSINEMLITKLTKEIESSKTTKTTTSIPSYNLSIGLNESYTTDENDFNTNANLDARKYLLTIPIIKSKLFISVGYENENVINLYTGHRIKTGLGIEL